MIHPPILREDFEPVDIQDTNNGRLGVLLLRSQGCVDPGHQPAEVLVVHSLGQRVPRILRLFQVQRSGDHVAASLDGAAGQCLAELGWVYFEKLKKNKRNKIKKQSDNHL